MQERQASCDRHLRMCDLHLDTRLAYLFRASGNDRLVEDALTRIQCLALTGDKAMQRHARRAINFLEKVL